MAFYNYKYYLLELPMIKVYPFILKKKSKLNKQLIQEEIDTNLYLPSISTINNILLYSKNIEIKASGYLDKIEITKS